MGSGKVHDLEASSAHKILRLLEALRHSHTGAVIYRQVEIMLEDLLIGHKNTEQAYLMFVTQLLDAYVGHLRDGSPLQVQVRLLQARLQPPLTAIDIKVLSDYVELYSSQIGAIQQLDTDMFRQAVEPLLAAFGIAEADSDNAHAVTSSRVVSVMDSDKLESAHSAAAEVQTLANGLRSGEPVLATNNGLAALAKTLPLAVDVPSTAAAAGNAANTAYRSHLDCRRRDIQKLQVTLAEQVLSTITQNQEFGVLLGDVLGDLRQASDGKALENLRWSLVREIEKLTKGHHQLAEKLDSTHHYLQLIESDSRQLNDELARVRLLSLTDELTGLPNRRAFLRRLEDEVARVQRYGFPLSLALIDLDYFKQVNDKYGHAGGDEVLELYSKNILSLFRHHDLVARYGGEEFAVLLPNTDTEGALRALTKVKNRASETRWQANDDVITVPGFSSGVSLYKPGETASAFIERADKALYRAKRLGRNRVEMDVTCQNQGDIAPEDDLDSEECAHHPF